VSFFFFEKSHPNAEDYTGKTVVVDGDANVSILMDEVKALYFKDTGIFPGDFLCLCFCFCVFVPPLQECPRACPGSEIFFFLILF
jgi:hypothetical protein